MKDIQCQFLQLLKAQIERTTESLKSEFEQKKTDKHSPFSVSMYSTSGEGLAGAFIIQELNPSLAVFKNYLEKVHRIINNILLASLHSQQVNLSLGTDGAKYPFTLNEYQVLLKSKHFSRWLDDTITDCFNSTLVKIQLDAFGIFRHLYIENIWAHLSQAESGNIIEDESKAVCGLRSQMNQLVSKKTDITPNIMSLLPHYLKNVPEHARKMSFACLENYHSRLQKAHGFLAHFGMTDAMLNQSFILETDKNAKDLRITYLTQKMDALQEHQTSTDSQLLKFIVALKEGRVRCEYKPLPVVDDIEHQHAMNFPLELDEIKKIRRSMPIADENQKALNLFSANRNYIKNSKRLMPIMNNNQHLKELDFPSVERNCVKKTKRPILESLHFHFLSCRREVLASRRAPKKPKIVEIEMDQFVSSNSNVKL